MSKRYSDDIDTFLEPAMSLKIRETDNYADKDGYGTPDHKIPPRATIGEEEVRHRSGGKPREGLSYEEKWDTSSVCRAIKSVLSHEEAQRIAFLLMDRAAAERKRMEEERTRLGITSFAYDWQSRTVQRYEYLSKEMRSS